MFAIEHSIRLLVNYESRHRDEHLFAHSSSVLKGHPFDTVVCACHDYAIEIGHVARKPGIDSEYSFVRIRFEAAELWLGKRETREKLEERRPTSACLVNCKDTFGVSNILSNGVRLNM